MGNHVFEVKLSQPLGSFDENNLKYNLEILEHFVFDANDTEKSWEDFQNRLSLQKNDINQNILLKVS